MLTGRVHEELIELTADELASLVDRRADVELYLVAANGVYSWVPARITGRTRGRTGVHVEVRRVDGSIIAFTYPFGEARRVIRIASSREAARANGTGAST